MIGLAYHLQWRPSMNANNIADRFAAAFGAPADHSAAKVRARRAEAATRGPRALAAFDALAARNSANLWAEVEAADAEENDEVES